MTPTFKVDFEQLGPKFTRPELIAELGIPLPLSGVNPRTIMGKEWWDEKRRKAYKTNNWCCWACGVGTDETHKHRLEAHECYDIDWKTGRMTFREIVALCNKCHSFIHRRRLQQLCYRRAGDASKAATKRYREVIRHGYALLTANDLYMQRPLLSGISWSNWCLVFDGKEYPPKFKDEAEVKAHYG
jgi:hypothetical protein